MDKKLQPTICILNPDDVYNLRLYHPEYSQYCLSPYEVMELQKDGVVFPPDESLQEGLVLTKKQNTPVYYFRTDATDCQTINERCLAIEAIMSYLGGEEFRYSETSSFRSGQDESVNASVSAEVKKVVNSKANINVGIGEHSVESSGKNVIARWNGNYSRWGYDRAQELARTNGLSSDACISALLEQRHPSHPNPIVLQEYQVNVTADLDRIVHSLTEITARIKKKIGVDLKVDTSTTRKIDKESTVSFFVKFGPIPSTVFQTNNGFPQQTSIKKRLWLIVCSLVIALLSLFLLKFLWPF